MRGVDGAVALWERLMEGVGLGAEALASVRLETKFTFNNTHIHYHPNMKLVACNFRKVLQSLHI